MIIVSCPYCYKANYVVVAEHKKHEQKLQCCKCGATYLIKITTRGKSRRVDAECSRIGEIASG